MLLIGYDVEAGTNGDLLRTTRTTCGADVTRLFLDRAKRLHDQYELPGTMFVVGEKLPPEIAVFGAHIGNPLLDFQQHTYTHVALKPSVVDTDGRLEFADWPMARNVEAAHEEIRRASAAFMSHLGRPCVGLSVPYGCFMGLVDRPDLLEVLRTEEIQYVRSFHLNKETADRADPLPVDFNVFSYEAQGFPEILELCLKGYSDVKWALKYGWEARESYVDYVKYSLDIVERAHAVWVLALHDWVQMEFNEDLAILDEIFSHVKRRHIEVRSFGELYARFRSDASMLRREKTRQRWEVTFSRRLPV